MIKRSAKSLANDHLAAIPFATVRTADLHQNSAEVLEEFASVIAKAKDPACSSHELRDMLIRLGREMESGEAAYQLQRSNAIAVHQDKSGYGAPTKKGQRKPCAIPLPSNVAI